MKKLNISAKQMKKYSGKWVIIDPQKNKIIAAGDNLKEIGHLAVRPETDKQPVGKLPYAYLIPRQDEGPYVL